MHRFERPPYLRWSAAAAVVVIAAAIEFWPQSTVEHPFIVSGVEAGEAVTTNDVSYRTVDEGMLPPVHVGGVAAIRLEPGEPLLPSHLTDGPTIPAGWWSLPVSMSLDVPVGTAVRLIEHQDGLVTDGILAAPPPDDPLAFDAAALIAVPAADVARLALSAARDEVTVVIAGLGE